MADVRLPIARALNPDLVFGRRADLQTLMTTHRVDCHREGRLLTLILGLAP